MNYDRAIKTVRALRGMSQQGLAQRMKVDEAFVSRLGKAGNSPSARTLEKVASALEIPMYLLVLLASDDDELGSMSKQEAETLGMQLLSLLLAAESSTARKQKRKGAR